MEEKYSLTLTVGILLWRSVRKFLKQRQKSGAEISFVEGPGFLTRNFVIKGNIEELIIIKKALSNWEEDP